MTEIQVATPDLVANAELPRLIGAAGEHPPLLQQHECVLRTGGNLAHRAAAQLAQQELAEGQRSWESERSELQLSAQSAAVAREAAIQAQR